MVNTSGLLQFLHLLAGIGIFLTGCDIMSSNLEAVCSDRLKELLANSPANAKYTVTDINGRVLSAARISSSTQEIRLANQGVMFVIVGNKTYKIRK